MQQFRAVVTAAAENGWQIAEHVSQDIVANQMLDVLFGTGKVIVQANHFMAIGNQAIAKMGPEKPRASRNEN